MSKLIFDEMMEVQQSVLENLSNIAIVAISDNQMIEVSADGNRNITNIHINEEGGFPIRTRKPFNSDGK